MVWWLINCIVCVPHGDVVQVMVSVQSPMVRSEEDLGPPWLRPLLGTSFFVPCPAHPDLSKNECNLFCLGCNDAAGALCSYCVPAHRDHHVVQVHTTLTKSYTRGCTSMAGLCCVWWFVNEF